MGGVFDLLADELLYKILVYFAQRSPSNVFFLEHCVNGSLRSSKEDESIQKENLLAYPLPMPIYYRHSNIDALQCMSFPKGQRTHCVDWLILNTTCCRIRRLGKEIFFRTRRFAMTLTMPLKLQQRSFTPTLSKADQELALKCIRDIALVHLKISTAASPLALPRRLAVFSNLRSCLLVYACCPFEGYDVIKKAVELATCDDEVDGSSGLGIPMELRDLLYDCGVPKHIQLKLAFPPGNRRGYCENEIKRSSYAMLRFKAQALQKQVGKLQE